MSSIMIFCRRDVKRKDGLFPLYANISSKGKRIRFPINVHVKLEDWNPGTQTLKGNTREIEDLNLIIANARAKISDVLVKARLTNEKLNKDIIYSRYKALDDGEGFESDTDNFVRFARGYLHEISSSISLGTYIRRKGIIKKVEDYDSQASFSTITPEWLRQYAAHCRDSLNNGPGTIKKNMDTIRLFFQVALRKGRAKKDPFDQYKVPVHYPDVVFLTEKEFKRLVGIRGRKDLTESQKLTLDMFLFMAFTGMHYTDAGETKIENLREGELHYRRQKTGTLVKVPLSIPALKLFNEYKGERQKGKLFLNYPCNQVMNRLIKEICPLVKIYKTVTVKTARHTFATIFYKKTKDLGTLSKLLGHTSVKNTMIYAHIMDEDRVKGISVFNDMM